MKSKTILLGGVAALITCALLSLQAETRNWTNASGKTINGELRGVKDGKAQLLVNGRLFEVPVDTLSEADQKYIAEKGDTEAAEKAAAEKAASSPILSKLNGNMKVSDGRKLTSFEIENPGKVEYVAFYHSASWCPPCRAFTPDLARTYKSLKRKHDNFELVLLSSDRSEADWEEYMKEYKMPWPGLEFGDSSTSTLKSFNKSRGIPSMTIVKVDGTVVDDGSRGARSSLAKLEDVLAGKE